LAKKVTEGHKEVEREEGNGSPREDGGTGSLRERLLLDLNGKKEGRREQPNLPGNLQTRSEQNGEHAYVKEISGKH